MIYGIISLIMCVGSPVLGGIYLSARGRPVFWSFLAGMLSFALTQLVVRLPLLRYLSTHWDWFMLLPYTGYFLYMGLLAISAGLFEETGRVACLGLLRRGKTGWIHGLAFGLGHGGVESIWIGLGSVLPAMLNGTASLAGASVLLAGVERICAMGFHVLMTYVVLEGIQRHKKLLFWLLAVLLHGLFDFTIAFQNQILIWSVLAGGLVMGAAAVLWTRKHWKEEDL